MSHLTKWGLALFVATLVTSLALLDNGQVSMVWQDWVIETSMTFALAVFLVVFALGYFMVRLVMSLIGFPAFWRRRRQIKLYSKAESSMAQGMLALEYGDWKTAERQLLRSAKTSQVGLVHYLNAAKMAHNQAAYDRREQYLAEARRRFPDEYITIGLVESRLLSEKQPEIAQAILAELHEQNPSHRLLLKEYAGVCETLNDWAQVEQLLPKLKKIGALPKLEIQALEERLVSGQLMNATSVETLEALWNSLSSALQQSPVVLAEYVEKRMGWGQEIGLAQAIEKNLRKHWDDRLVYQYGRITLGPAFERLKKAETWLKTQPENPVLFLTLGRLACMSQLWGQGQHFLKQSLKLRAELETFHALAKCYEAEGEEGRAALTYKEAILQLEKKS